MLAGRVAAADEALGVPALGGVLRKVALQVVEDFAAALDRAHVLGAVAAGRNPCVADSAHVWRAVNIARREGIARELRLAARRQLDGGGAHPVALGMALERDEVQAA